MKTIVNKIAKITTLFIVISIIISCQPEEPKSNGLAISADALNADFTIDQSKAASNEFKFIAKTENILANSWDIGDGNNPIKSGNTVSAFIPDAGTYTIQHTAVGRGGASKTKSETLVVATSDLASGNLVQGGKFLYATDHAKWTILNIAGTHINWTFGNGFANVGGSSPSQYAQQGLYQALQVIGGKKYKLDMKVSGSPCLNTWFEVYVGTVVPQQNNAGGDYNSGGKRLSIKTFDGCLMTSAFNGKLSELNCDGSGSTIQFPTSGTVYLVIRSGGFGNNTLGLGGVKVTNVEFRGIK